MAAPAPADASRRLLAYSDDRTIWRRRAADFDRVVKVFERGNPAAAEAEARAGARLRGPGFVDYLGVETDPETGRPAVITRFVDAPDLAHVVAAQGLH